MESEEQGNVYRSGLVRHRGRSPDDQSYPTGVATFSLLFGFTSSGSFQTLQTVDQVDDQVDEHGNENRAIQSVRRVAIVLFVLIHSIAIPFHCHWNPARKKERKWTPRWRGGHPASPPGALSYLRYPFLQKLSYSTNYPS